jgi:hypothetical protein
MMTRFPASTSFPNVPLGGQPNQFWRHERQIRYLAGKGRAGCTRVAAVPSIEDEGKEEGHLACARMEVGRAAVPHWPELGHPGHL